MAKTTAANTNMSKAKAASKANEPLPEAPPSDFVHLHLHSQFSLLDGGNRLDRLIARVKELGMPAVAVTDHGNLFGAMDFHQRATKAGIKPILGIEAYVAPEVDGVSDRTNKVHTGVADGGHHLVLLAENDSGWQNLLKLSSDSFLEGFYYKPRMDKATLAQWADGLIAINGHLGSSIAFHLRRFVESKDDKHYAAAVEEARWHAATFPPGPDGEPRFYIELQVHEVKDQREINPLLVKIADELDLPLVVDNDAHYLLQEDWATHDVLCCISMAKTRDAPDRLRYPKDLHVTSPVEMWDRLMHDPLTGVPPERGREAFEATAKIAERCHVNIEYGRPLAPVVRIETDFPGLPQTSEAAIKMLADAAKSKDLTAEVGSNAWYAEVRQRIRVEPFDEESGEEAFDADELKTQCDGALRLLVEAGAIWRYGENGVTEEKRARIERELTVLRDKLISAYFMIVWDFVNEARRRDIPVLARGSGVGTMTGFCLGLSNACPVEYGLLFERFTDPDRTEYPDIDIDMCQDGRQDLIDFVRRKYGYVAQIITFNVLKAKAAIRDVGRVLGVSIEEVNRICRLVPDQLNITLDDALEAEPELKRLADEETASGVKGLIGFARDLEGMARHAGVHAAGVIVATQPLEKIVPLYKPPGSKTKKKKDDDSEPAVEQIVTQWDGPTCEKIGLLKMDFLGLRTLSIITLAVDLVRKSLMSETIYETVNQGRGRHGLPAMVHDPLDLERLTFDDTNVFAMFARGETAGVFQFESDGMRNLLMDMRPDQLGDLIAANALYRPGPMDLIPNYNNRKHGREETPKQGEIVDKFTAETNGIMVYQEQVMQIVHELGKIPLRQAYTLIKAIGKKYYDVIESNRTQFIKGAGEQGVTEKDADDLFELILKFAGYGFNKSHSTGYAIVAYQTAYLKTYFPLQYMCALLTFEADNTDKIVGYIDEARRVRKPDGTVGLDVRPPDVNVSGLGFTPVYEGEHADDPKGRTASDGYIRFGLRAVRGVGDKAIRAIIDEREERGPYQSIHGFCERVNLRAVNKACVEALIKCGAFDGLYEESHGDFSCRSGLMAAMEPAMVSGQRAAADRDSGQMNFFASAADAPTEDAPASPIDEKPVLPDLPAWTTRQMLEFEKESLGFYVSAHPLDEFDALLDQYTTCTAAQAIELADGAQVAVGGLIAGMRTPLTARGKMAAFQIDDRTARVEAVAFSRIYAMCAGDLIEDLPLIVRGKIDRKRGQPQLIVDDVIPLEQAVSRMSREMRIVVNDPKDPAEGSSFDQEFVQLRHVLRQASRPMDQSATPVDVVMDLHQGGYVVSIRMPEMRVVPSEDLADRVKTILNGACHCRFLGPAKIRISDPGNRHDGVHRGDQLGPKSNREKGVSASVDRY